MVEIDSDPHPASPGCRSRPGKMMKIRSDLDPQHCSSQQSAINRPFIFFSDGPSTGDGNPDIPGFKLIIFISQCTITNFANFFFVINSVANRETDPGG
jgi:hypothetical protein